MIITAFELSKDFELNNHAYKRRVPQSLLFQLFSLIDSDLSTILRKTSFLNKIAVKIAEKQDNLYVIHMKRNAPLNLI